MIVCALFGIRLGLKEAICRAERGRPISTRTFGELVDVRLGRVVHIAKSLSRRIGFREFGCRMLSSHR